MPKLPPSLLLPLPTSTSTPTPGVCVCSSQARGPVEQSRLGVRRSCGCSCCWGERRRWLPCASLDFPSGGRAVARGRRQLEGIGKEGPSNSSSASPLLPLLAPALGESGVWRSVVVISSDCFAVHGFSFCPVGLSSVCASLCSPPLPRHTSVYDEERSTGDSGPLRTGTGILAANARTTCPGPAQRQRHWLRCPR